MSDYPFFITLFTAFISACGPLITSDDKSFTTILYRFLHFPLWVPIVVFTLCGIIRRYRAFRRDLLDRTYHHRHFAGSPTGPVVRPYPSPVAPASRDITSPQ